MTLNDLIGKQIVISLFESNISRHDTVLHGVEVGGIWVESHYLEEALGFVQVPPNELSDTPPFKPVFFIPYSRIKVIVAASTDLNAINL